MKKIILQDFLPSKQQSLKPSDAKHTKTPEGNH